MKTFMQSKNKNGYEIEIIIVLNFDFYCFYIVIFNIKHIS